MSAGQCVRFIIHGKVQGVFFRESTRREALKLGLDGHALNRPDGTVEVLAQGSGVAIAQLAVWLQRGPVMARVQRVEQLPYEDAVAAGFITG